MLGVLYSEMVDQMATETKRTSQRHSSHTGTDATDTWVKYQQYT